MMTRKNGKFKLTWLGLCLALTGLMALAIACKGAESAPSSAPVPVSPATQSAPSVSSTPAPSTTTAPEPKLMKSQPDKGYVGESFTITGDGLPPNKEVQLQWATVDGGYDDKVFTETIEFYERKFTNKRITLAKATTDAQGKLTTALTVPDDFGEVHDIYAVADGQDVARGGYRVLPEFSVSPLEGPVGTPITIKARGIGWKNWESTWGINWDNSYTGYVTAITTRGSATAIIRATGITGLHIIDVWHAGQTVPYLNWEQSPQGHIPVFHYTFKVTNGNPQVKQTLDWPDKGPESVAVPAQRTTASNKAIAGGASAAITPQAGPVLSKATLKLSKLPASAGLEFFFVTARGSRTSGLGWGLSQISLGKDTAAADGTLTKQIEIPDDLGGWHSIIVAQGDKVLAEVPFLVQPSLVTVTPARVKVGDTFKVNLKGVGWTELDNIYAVDYDNSYIGFVCGFNSNGDVTLNLKATGSAGVHLIDIYPAIYQGHGKPPWLYDTPQLTALQDHPSLSLGYRLPIFRLAIEVTE